jgi:hypothetical protein
MKNFALICALCLMWNSIQSQSKNVNRQSYVDALVKIADPVLVALSKNKLKKEMPFESASKTENDRQQYTYLEAFGRTISGIAPWLELGPDETSEGKLREKYINLTLKCLDNATNPKAADFMNFSKGSQPLVDAAFLAQGLLRAPNQLWGRLNKETQQNIITQLKNTRKIVPGYNNWILFSAIIEAALLKFDGDGDRVRIMFALSKHEEWYLGDGIYGDGPEFHWDYYNSFVIQPMLIDIYSVLIAPSEESQNEKVSKTLEHFSTIINRAQKYAQIQEKLIAPDGTYPPIGRSLAYRFGAFQLLSQLALLQKLPENLHPAQVRNGLLAVIKRQMKSKTMFDDKGWLRIGFYGYQPEMGQFYISTGSLYLCNEVFLVLGLAPDNKFWNDADEDWSQKKIWSE